MAYRVLAAAFLVGWLSSPAEARHFGLILHNQTCGDVKVRATEAVGCTDDNHRGCRVTIGQGFSKTLLIRDVSSSALYPLTLSGRCDDGREIGGRCIVPLSELDAPGPDTGQGVDALQATRGVGGPESGNQLDNPLEQGPFLEFGGGDITTIGTVITVRLAACERDQRSGRVVCEARCDSAR